jgi:hypothetical protein
MAFFFPNLRPMKDIQGWQNPTALPERSPCPGGSGPSRTPGSWETVIHFWQMIQMYAKSVVVEVSNLASFHAATSGRSGA